MNESKPTCGWNDAKPFQIDEQNGVGPTGGYIGALLAELERVKAERDMWRESARKLEDERNALLFKTLNPAQR